MEDEFDQTVVVQHDDNCDDGAHAVSVWKRCLAQDVSLMPSIFTVTIKPLPVPSRVAPFLGAKGV